MEKLTLRSLATAKTKRFCDDVDKVQGTTNLNADWIFNRMKKLLLPGNYIACETCGIGSTWEAISIDHKVPRSYHYRYEGSIHDVKNLQLVCPSCNSLKGQRLQQDFLDFLTHKNQEIMKLRQKEKKLKNNEIIAPLFPHIGYGQSIFGPDKSIAKFRRHKKISK